MVSATYLPSRVSVFYGQQKTRLLRVGSFIVKTSCKPDSVVEDDYLSGKYLAIFLKPPTLNAFLRGTHAWSCTRWGLHRADVATCPRELLPHDFALTFCIHAKGGMFLLRSWPPKRYTRVSTFFSCGPSAFAVQTLSAT